MDGYQLIASLVSSLAWPVAVACIIIVFRKQLALIARLKYGDAEVEFKKDVERAIVAADKRVDQQGILPEYASALLSVNPRSAVIEVFTNLEAAIRLKAAELVSAEAMKGPLSDAVNAFYNAGYFSSADVNLFMRLREMRNNLVHSGVFSSQIDKSDAKMYAMLAHQLMQNVLSLKKR